MSKRKDILHKAEQCICSDREQEYGSPKDNFERIAKLWSTYLSVNISAFDVAVLMALLKIGRMSTGQAKEDNHVDAAGYIALAWELTHPEVDIV